MVQGGDYQNGDGSGGEAYDGGRLMDESSFELKHDAPGVLSMANRGKNTAGSQFFITLGRTQHLDGKHVVFGRVVDGMDVVLAMAKVETDEKDRPVSMQQIVIVDCGVGDGNYADEEDDSIEQERKSKKKSHKKKSSKRDKYDSSDDDSSSSSRRRDRKHRKKSSRKRDKDSGDEGNSYESRELDKKRRKEKRRKSDDYSSDDESSDDGRDRRRKKSSRKDKHRKKKRSRHYSDDDSDSSDDSRRRSKKDRKSKSHKRSKESSRSRSRKDKDDDKVVASNAAAEKNSFGKYGIVRDNDFMTSNKVKRNFEIWLEEVKVCLCIHVCHLILLYHCISLLIIFIIFILLGRSSRVEHGEMGNRELPKGLCRGLQHCNFTSSKVL